MTKVKKVIWGEAPIFTAHKDATVGSKITDREAFIDGALNAFINHDQSKDRAPGQHFIELENAHEYVTAGVGLRSDSPDHYIKRNWRGHMELYLKREYAVSLENEKTFLIVYTREAMLNDPETSESFRQEILNSEYTHYLVALLAGPGDRGPYRLVDSIAGGNNEFNNATVEYIKECAKRTKAHYDKYVVVSD
jgi:hypothetical protein